MFWNRVTTGAITLTVEVVIRPPDTAVVQFGATPTTVVASEIADVSASLTLLRTGNNLPVCSVEWALTGTMTAADYVSGQLLEGITEFPSGAPSAVVTIRLKPAVAGTADKTIIVSLSSPINCEIGAGSSRTIAVDMPGLVDPPENPDEYPTPLRVITVDNEAELRTVIGASSGTFPTNIDVSGTSKAAPLRPGDRVLCKNGNYSGSYSLDSSISGSITQPIIIIGESLFGCKFTGRFSVNRPDVRIVNFEFSGNSCGVTLSGARARMHRCWLHDVNSGTSTSTGGNIVTSFSAPDAMASYCLWSDMDARSVSGKSETQTRMHLYRCHFKDSKPEPASGLSAREGIQIGQTFAGGDGLAGSLSPAHTNVNSLIEYCLFTNMNQAGGDENETISVKSSGNTIRQCTFVDCQYLMIRGGNDNRIEGNWFENAGGPKNRGIGVHSDRNVIIGNRMTGSGLAIRAQGGNMDMACARYDKPTAGNYGTPRYMNPRATDPGWPEPWSRPWSYGGQFNSAGNPVSSGGSNDPDYPMARDCWYVGNNCILELGTTGGSSKKWWQSTNNRVRAHTGTIRTQNAYPGWANVPTVTANLRETGSTYSTTVDAQFLPLPAAAKRLTASEVGPSAPWIPPPGTVVPEPVTKWWTLPIRSGRAWAAGVSYWYDRDAPYNTVTAAQEFDNEEADVGLIDAATGSTHTDTGGAAQGNVATWDGVIGGTLAGAMDTTQTQFDWSSTTCRYGFQEAVDNLPVDPVLYPDGSGWLIWVVILIPNTESTSGGDSSIWDDILAGDHDARYQKFGERIVRRMALTGHPLKRLILDVHHEMNQTNTYRVYAATRTKYRDAMERAFNQIRQGASAYQAGAGAEFKFLHRPAYRENIGSLVSYCPRNVDCVGLSWHPGDNATTSAQLTQLMNGEIADTYGIATELLDLATSLNVPICFSEHSPNYGTPNAAAASPIADIATQKFHDFLVTISDKLVADCVYHQNIRYLTGFEGTGSAGDAAWRRMVPLRKTLWSGKKTSYLIPPSLSFAGATETTVNSTATLQAALDGQANGTSLVINLADAVYGAVTKSHDLTTPTTRRLKIVASTKVFTAYDPITGVKSNYSTGHARFTGTLILRGYDELLIEGLEVRTGGTGIETRACNKSWVKHCDFTGLQATGSEGTLLLLLGNLLDVNQECSFLNVEYGTAGPTDPDMDYAIRWHNGKDWYIAGCRIEGLYHQPVSMKEDQEARGYLRFDSSELYGRSPLAAIQDTNQGLVLGQTQDSTTRDVTCVRADLLRSRFRCGTAQNAVNVWNVATTIIDGCVFDGCASILDLRRDGAVTGGGTAAVLAPIHPLLTHMKNCTVLQDDPILLQTRGRGSTEVLRLENNTVPTLLDITKSGTGLAIIDRVGGNASGFNP